MGSQKGMLNGWLEASSPSREGGCGVEIETPKTKI